MQITNLLWTLGLLAIGAQGLPRGNTPGAVDSGVQPSNNHLSHEAHPNGSPAVHESNQHRNSRPNEADQGYEGTLKRGEHGDANNGYFGAARALTNDADQGYEGGVKRDINADADTGYEGFVERSMNADADTGYEGAAERGINADADQGYEDGAGGP